MCRKLVATDTGLRALGFGFLGGFCLAGLVAHGRCYVASLSGAQILMPVVLSLLGGRSASVPAAKEADKVGGP